MSFACFTPGSRQIGDSNIYKSLHKADCIPIIPRNNNSNTVLQQNSWTYVHHSTTSNSNTSWGGNINVSMPTCDNNNTDINTALSWT